MNKDTREKAAESSIGEILDAPQKQLDVCWVIQTKFFHQGRTVRCILQSFRSFQKNLQTVQNSGK